LTRLRSLSIAVGLVLAAPATAGAATLDAGKSCYFNNNLARLAGSGFAPDSPITFSVNGRTLNETVRSDTAGDVLVRYDPPRTRTQRKLVIRATDSEGTSARTTIFATARRRVTADPDRARNVRTWRAVFRLFGFGRGKAFIHYLDPDGELRKTVKLGRLRGPCGRLKTGERRVMPFRNPEFGVWRLQFDPRRRYDPDTVRKRVIPVRVYRGR
jgi:hypothetical protein